ncbi:hypothetical protein SETIT_8G146600v2 [Setaria italica]|uniref:NB-ARC domain-containing protein n=1 Tax=Setaria italica TaxID=4555 RepID=A0A368S7S3_SETIT|nr:putative disease resistance protein RGA3 [Setaria italica]RCV38486.1 hypothetical protein SETIT_8G146600v2 [Setaria italica]RCV38487.1 hypothetical protein SETIT_8G146600v2 [Setaria italica]
MASGLLSPLLSSARKLLDLLWSPAAAAPRGERFTFSADLQRLERLLRRIQATLDDVGEREIQESYVKLWIEELTVLARDAEDVLDDYRYEMLRRRAQELQGSIAAAAASSSSASRKRIHEEDEGGSISERIRKITRRFQISTDRAALPLRPDEEDDGGTSERIGEIIRRFEEISRDRAALQLGPDDGIRIAGRESQWESRTSSHLFDESLVFGRTDEKERIIQLVLSRSQDNKTHVLPVVGMGGIGKTTMAQMVYNDGRVQERFDLMGWVHVSETFDLRRLTIAIYESLTRRPCEYNELSSVHDVLKEKLCRKSVFVVLDDLWNERHSFWQDLMCPLEYAESVMILVTTRSKEVARVVQTFEPLVLCSLSEEHCWLLFQHYAFGDRIIDDESSLLQVGRKIMQKCGGLPLAVKSIGCLLRFKRDMQTWLEISKSEFWEYSDDNEEIFCALRLSFHRLPARLKPCFLLCALYPKGQPFAKDDMIHLWIAHGFIQNTGCKTIERLAGEYFDELTERSLIETDLVRLRIHESRQLRKKPLSRPRARSPAIGEIFNTSHNIYELHIRSLVDTFREKTTKASLSFLRFRLHDMTWDLAKSLSSCLLSAIAFDEGSLYLGKKNQRLSFWLSGDTSRQNTQRYNPQVITIANSEFSYKMNYLRTLVLKQCTFFHIGINEFRYLRALVLDSCKDSGCISATQYLKLLRYLHVSNCDALFGKNLKRLTESICHLYSLEKLIVSSCRKEFSMKSCNLFSLRYLQLSVRFNDWSLHPFCQFDNLDTLCLQNCDSIAELPICIGNLLNLRRLQLFQISKIKKLNHYCFRCHTNNNRCGLTDVIFPALEELEFDGLCDLQEWCKLQESDYPKMQSITIRNCYKLRRIPYFGSLRNLIITKSALIDLQLSVYNKPSQLQFLDIRDCWYLKSLKGLKNLCSLGSLYIAHCPKLIVLRKENLRFRPQHVCIDDCPGLKDWCDEQELYYQVPKMVKISDIKRAKEHGIAYFQSCEHICLDICPDQGPELILSPDNWLPSELRLLKFGFEGVPLYYRGLSTLGKLEIRGCPKLEALIDLEELNIHSLVLADCPLLYMLPEMKFPGLLTSLIVEGCHKLMSLYLNISHPSTFTELEISDCQGLMYIGGLGCLSKLESLVLLHCRLLELQGLLPVIPESVVVFLCPKLKKWCEIQSIEYMESLPDLSHEVNV